MSEPKIFLVNPAKRKNVGFSFITPRWLPVIANATPREVGDPIAVDETIEAFNPAILSKGDIVGIGITTLNCLPGYEITRQAKLKGATVLIGGVHATIAPDEALEMGADSVITGGGDVIWRDAVKDALAGKLKKYYHGGRVPGELLLPGRWDVLDTRKYMAPSVQTSVGCPENCTFCSVWTTEGRKPRQRAIDVIANEVNELKSRWGFPVVIFADDNFNPAVLGRIQREKSPSIRRELERNREMRLAFFAEYAKRVPRKPFAFTQMTSEIETDPEYLKAAHDQMNVCAALLGIESVTREGLTDVRKSWNKRGDEMQRIIKTIEENGICVLASMIFGLPSDTPLTARIMKDFLRKSGATAAQVTVLTPLLGTVDTNELLNDRSMLAQGGQVLSTYRPKQKVRLIGAADYRFWLDPKAPSVLIEHPIMDKETILKAVGQIWDDFYSLPAIAQRALLKPWKLKNRICLALFQIGFKSMYGGRGVCSDSVSDRQIAPATRFLMGAAMNVYNRWFRSSDSLA